MELAQIAMTEADARRLTERIRIAAVNYSEAKEKLLRLVSDAKEGSAHVALGYASWTAYLADVMSEEPLRLARDERREVVQLLSEEGMSRPAIAQVTGVNERTTQRDFGAIRQGETPVSPSPPPPPRIQSAPSAPSPAPAPTKVTGMDGKQYSRPVPRVEPAARQIPPRVRRQPITDVIARHADTLDVEFTKLIDSLDDPRATSASAQEMVGPAINRWRLRLQELAQACGLEQNETPAKSGEGP